MLDARGAIFDAGGEVLKTVLHITEVLSGGVLPVISGICNGLDEEYRFIVAYGIRQDTPRNLSDLFSKKIKLIPLESFHLKLSLKDDFSTIKKLRKIVKQEKPDIIHIHSTKAGLLARLGLLGIHVKKYYTPHGFCFMRKDQNSIKRLVLRCMEKVLTYFCNGVIACGKAEYDEARKLTKKAICVENGIDTDFIDDIVKATPKVEHKYTVYTAGRIGPQKNADAFNEIAKKNPEIRFVWIGDGEDRNLLTSDNIEVTGVLPRTEVIKRAVNYDCYLSTSLWEGLPIALMEAMYMGKKCVVSDVEGNNELIIHGVTGGLFNNKHNACAQISDSNNLGEFARRFIEEKYSIEGMRKKYEKVYG